MTEVSLRILILYSGDLQPRSLLAPGGVNGNLRSYLGGMPPDWEIEMWGAAMRGHPTGDKGAHELDLGGRSIRLRPIVTAGPAKDRRIPISPIYAAALAREVVRGRLSTSRWDAVIVHRAEFLAAAANAKPWGELPPALLMLHSHSGHAFDRRRLKGRASLLGERLAIGAAATIAVVSAASQAYYKAAYPAHAAKFHWIPNGVNVGRFASGDRHGWRERHGFAPGDRVLLYHGRYDREKGIGRMLAMFRLLLDDGAPWHLVTAGVGPLEVEIAAASGSWGAGRIHDVGHLAPAEIPDLLHAADLGILCSDFEGLSNSLLEALASGVPVVATDAGDNRLVLERVAKELVAEPSPGELARAIRWAWAERSQLSRRARLSAANFSQEKRNERLARMIRAVAAGEPYSDITGLEPSATVGAGPGPA